MFSIVLHADSWLARATSAALNAGTILHGTAHVADSRALISNNRKTASVASVPVVAFSGHIDCDAWTFAYRKCCGACKAVTENNSKHPSRICGGNCAAGGSSTVRNVGFLVKTPMWGWLSRSRTESAGVDLHLPQPSTLTPWLHPCRGHKNTA